MKRKKKGSSLIYVIIIFMFVSVVSTAMISMISANYRARVVENNRVENLYGSDSGIDVAYNIMSKTFDAATKYGYYRVKTLTDKTITDKSKCKYADKYASFNADIDQLNEKIADLKKQNNKDDTRKETIEQNNKNIDIYYKLIEDDKNFIEVLLNEEFKCGFKDFFERILKSSIEHKEYVYKVEDLNKIDTTYVKYEANNDSDKEANLDVDISNPPYIIKGEDDPNYGIKPSEGHAVDEVIFEKTADKAYKIKMTSNFNSTNMSYTVDGNNRTVEANYVIKIPNYNDIFFGKSTSNDKYLALEDRGLIVGKDMNVENVGQLTVSGNVFVNGEDPKVELNDGGRTYKKYSGGIMINNNADSTIEFKKDVITRNTFNIQDKTTTTIYGNLYAGNVYIGKIADGVNGFAHNSKLYITETGMGKVILDNDLTVKAQDSEIEMNDFYGINDNNIYYKDENNEDKGKNSDVSKSSSSIIINGYKGGNIDSKVTINKSAYIMGTAHIATDNNYQTAESGAVINNYMAYSVPDPIDTTENFGYHDPLYLLDEDNVFKKAVHFKNYWDPKKNADSGGIVWPKTEDGHNLNVHSIGAIVYEEGGNKFVMKPNYTTDLEDVGETYADSGVISQRRIDFASKVYKFGQPAEIGEYNQSVSTDFNLLMDLSSISEYTELGDNEKAVFNPDINTTVVIQGKNYKGVTLSPGKSEKIIKTDDKGNINAVVATEGDVIIDGDVTFNGAIVCKGYLNIKENNRVTINYNPDVISRLQSQNENMFKDVFGGMMFNKDETSTPNKSEVEILDTNYDINKFLQTILWKLKNK